MHLYMYMYLINVSIKMLWLLLDGLGGNIQFKNPTKWILDILWYLPSSYVYNIIIYHKHRIMVRRYGDFACVAVVIGYGMIILRDAADADAADDRFTQSRRKK